MKKLLVFVTSLLATTALQAQTSDQTYSYAQDRVDQGYNYPRTYPQAGAYGVYDQSVPAPVSSQAYGFYQQAPTPNYNQQQQAVQQRQLTWYPTQQQRMAAYGGSYYENVPQQPNVYRSPVYNSHAMRHKKDWYADLHLGVGATMGWEHGFDDPVAPMWGIALGTRVSPTVRVEAAFDYHTEGKLASYRGRKINYRQYDLGANIYYGFPTNASLPIKPFVGAGIWGVKGKASAKYRGLKIAGADSDIKLGISVAAGVTYPINEMFSAVAMGRLRYINCKEDLYNLEGLIGLRYHF